MKPMKAAVPFAKWLLRIALLAFVLVMFFDTASTLNLKSTRVIVAMLYILFAILLFIGGFTAKATLTVISGLVIFILSVYKIAVLFDGDIEPLMASYLIVASIGFYFMARGNFG
jgi:hypothetical protein